MNESQVVQYLAETPDFFERHLDLLEGLTIPHPVADRGVISLLERQVLLLRHTASTHKAQFERLVAVARENEAIMLKSRRLILDGLGCVNTDDFTILIDDALKRDFDVPYHSLILFSEKHANANVRTTSLAEAEPVLKQVLRTTGCYCGVLSVSEAQYLFATNSNAVMSAAVLPLVSRYNGQIEFHGVLALGSATLDKFNREKGDLFLEYLSDLLSAILLRLEA